MASGIENLVSVVTPSISVPAAPAARPHTPARPREQRSGAGVPEGNRPVPQQDSGRLDWEKVAQARKETLDALMEYAQRAALASDTTIYYQRDDQNGRMYLHVVDKETGKELYRIPKHYLSTPALQAAESHQLDVQVWQQYSGYTMGTINLINGGLDIQGIVDNLIYVQREPIRRLEEQSKTYQDRVSAYQAFNTKLLAFKASVENLLYQGDEVPFSFPSSFEERLNHSVFALRTAQSSDEAVLTATASKGAMVGDFTVSVSRLAKFDTYASNNFASDTGTATQTGAIVIQQGDADPVTVTVDDTNNTLQGIRDAINRASAGVRATIVRDGSASPYRLVLTSSESGTANALTITNNLNQGSGQAVAFNRTVAAEDAALQVNGIEIVSTSNTVTDAIEGVTLNLRAASGTAVVTVGRDLDSIVAALKDFAAKYNDVAGYISSQFSYDATEKKVGLLAGDFTLRRAQGMISSTLMGTINSDGAALRLLAQVGLKRNSDGTLTVDEAKLEQALESDLRGTAHVFLADAQDAAGATVSIAPQLFNQLKSLTDGLEGPVFRAQDAVQQGIMRINRQIEQMEERLEKQREILIAQFAKADEALRQLNVLQTSLNSQINALQGLA